MEGNLRTDEKMMSLSILLNPQILKSKTHSEADEAKVPLALTPVAITSSPSAVASICTSLPFAQ